MSDRKKGFDPLSSLFDAPDPGAVKPDSKASGMDLTVPNRKFPRPDEIPAALDEDAPTEMAPVPKAADLPEAREEIAGAGPLKKRSTSGGNVEFIGELPASDDWTESKPEALFSLNQPPVPDPDEEVAPDMANAFRESSGWPPERFARRVLWKLPVRLPRTNLKQKNVPARH